MEQCAVQVWAGLSGTYPGSVVWTDVTPYTVASDGIHATRGVQGNLVTDRVASTGTLSFSLHNVVGGVYGYWTPGHPNCVSGWALGTPLRLTATYLGVLYDLWYGVLDTAEPQPGLHGEHRVVAVTGADWMDDCARSKLYNIPTQVNQRGDQLMATILANLARQPYGTAFNVGTDVYPFALDTVQDSDVAALTEFQNLANSELCYIYIDRHGNLCYEPRRYRVGLSTPTVTLTDNELYAMKASRQRQQVVNRVQITLHPRRVDSAPTSVLFVLNGQTQLARGASTTFDCPYRDPNQTATRVGGQAMVTPVATTDYTFNTASDGTGTDITSQLSVSVTFGGNSATAVVTNNGPKDGYITKFQLRGEGLYSYQTTVYTQQDASSQASYGMNSLTIDAPYASQDTIGTAMSSYVLSMLKSPYVQVDEVSFLANASPALMVAALTADVSAMVSVLETMSIDVAAGTAKSYFVNAVQVDVDDSSATDTGVTGGAVLTVTWILTPADPLRYWRLGTVGYSELGVTTRPSYGAFASYWVLGQSALGSSTVINPD